MENHNLPMCKARVLRWSEVTMFLRQKTQSAFPAAKAAQAKNHTSYYGI